MLFTSNDLINCLHGPNRKTVFMTITNYGYILYTLNMLKSLSKWGLDKKVLVICIDEKSNNVFLRLGYQTYYYNSNLHKFAAWNTTGYDKICYYKLLAICKVIESGYDLFFIDGDIVFRNDPINMINIWHNKISTKIFMQNDTMSNTNRTNLCSGCMFIKSSDITKKYFVCDTPDTIDAYNKWAGINNDQSFINEYIKPYIDIEAMPLELFPNGKYFMENSDAIINSAILVHFNWIIGHEKMAKIKQYGMWYLTPEEEDAT